MHAQQSRAIYYAIDTNPAYLRFARNSIASLRSHNADIPVYLFMYGVTDGRADRFFSRHGVCVRRERGKGYGTPTFLKWLALRELKEQNILFVDADTVFYRDPAALFCAFSQKDFYARREIGTSKARYRDERFMTRYQLKDGLFSSLVKSLRIRTMPVFNTGIMLFCNSIHREFSFRDFVFYHRLFQSRRIPYPCTNSHIVEEIVASLVMGGMPSLECGLFTRAVTPWYREIRLRRTREFGIITHVGSADYKDYERSLRASSEPRTALSTKRRTCTPRP